MLIEIGVVPIQLVFLIYTLIKTLTNALVSG